MSACLTLKKSNCKNCYKCIRNCPVKAIGFSDNQAYIIQKECILCGKCIVVCPQDAKKITSQTDKVKTMIQNKETVIASLDSSFMANYKGVGIESMRKALMSLGFSDVEEASVGASEVKKCYEELVSDNSRDIVISSSCPSVNLLIQKYFPEEIKYLANVLSPMQAHCKSIKKRHPGSKVVHICPCIAKKQEAQLLDGIPDAVLTFDELSLWFKESNIHPETNNQDTHENLSRLFVTAGGIIKTMENRSPDYTYILVDGIENCIMALKDIESGHIHKCFIEMSACTGSCIGGPLMENKRRSPIRDFSEISKSTGGKDYNINILDHEEMKKDFPNMIGSVACPSEKEISDYLRLIGKNSPADELNCSRCGYNTCRDFVCAIINGKADVCMCLPFLKSKAESFTDNIIFNSPNGIFLLNNELEILQINNSAKMLFNITEESEILGKKVSVILNEDIFSQVLSSRNNVSDKKVYLSDFDKYVEQSVIYDKNYQMLVCILRDVTIDEKLREKKENISRRTAEIADKVVDKQMRIVQEIASLLGETAAETKVALTKLKENLTDE